MCDIAFVGTGVAKMHLAALHIQCSKAMQRVKLTSHYMYTVKPSYHRIYTYKR